MAKVTFKQESTGKTLEVSNIKRIGEREYFFTVRNKGCGTKFFNRNVCFADNGGAFCGDKRGTSLLLNDGWVAVDEPKAHAPRTKVAAKAEPTTAPTTTEPEPAAAPAAPKAPANINETAKAIADALAGLKVQGTASVDEATVRRIVAEEIAKAKPAEVVHKIKVNNTEPKELPNGQEPHPLLEKTLKLVANDRVIGRSPWLFGPAGSGKSTLAKQVADAMGLPFYSVSSLQQKYELEGYTDAAGELVKTTFYEAAKKGGIFLFDEVTTTSAEVQVAFNSMLANLWYNFPKEGMIKAHPDFHVIAADNTNGRGADSAYCARFQLDASTLDRYCFVEVDYTPEHDLRMANGDKDLVAFIKDVRRALTSANLTYLATPRASKAIKALEAIGFSDKEAMFTGLCSGWDAQDLRTIQKAVTGTTRWHKAFKAI